MGKPARRLFRKFKPGKYTKLSDSAWRGLEKIVGKRLPDEVRQKIDRANEIYVSFRPLHTDEQVLNVSKARSALEAWIKTSRRLMRHLRDNHSVREIDRKQLIGRFSGKKRLRRLERMQPLVFFDYVLEGVIGIGLNTVVEIDDVSLSPELKAYMGFAWVQLIALAMEEAKVKISASSSNKGTESPFVRAIISLQGFLPDNCKTYRGYESTAKGVQRARRKFKDVNADALYGTIIGFGTGVLGNYDSKTAPEIIAYLLTEGADNRDS